MTRKSVPILLADVVQGADVRVVQAGDGLGFPLEALAEIGIVGDMRQEHLDGDGAIQPGVGSFVDFSHAPSAEGGLDFLGTESCTGSQTHEVKMTVLWTSA